ncbi:MAG: GNAT family N-acetyltransferase [Acidobacteria bacterium]|nr:GNAT family N-acetyltransferase [Acidobacteriota bacterium]
MANIERFSTERLIAERLTEAHFEELRLLWQDPRMMTYSGGVRSEENIRERLRKSLGHWEAHGFGRWICRERRKGELVGMCNLRHIVVEGTPEMDVGYAVRFELSGTGLATEMVRAVLSLAFDPIGVSNVIALIDPANTASRRVAEKAGLTYERDALFHGDTGALYRIRRDEPKADSSLRSG